MYEETKELGKFHHLVQVEKLKRGLHSILSVYTVSQLLKYQSTIHITQFLNYLIIFARQYDGKRRGAATGKRRKHGRFICSRTKTDFKAIYPVDNMFMRSV